LLGVKIKAFGANVTTQLFLVSQTDVLVCLQVREGFYLQAAGSCHKRKKPQAPIRNRQTRKVANAKDLNRS